MKRIIIADHELKALLLKLGATEETTLLFMIALDEVKKDIPDCSDIAIRFTLTEGFGGELANDATSGFCEEYRWFPDEAAI